MGSNITIFSVSEDFIATKLTTITDEFFVDLKKFFKIREANCRYIICTGFNHDVKPYKNPYEYDFYEILNSNFLPVIHLDGIYQLTNFRMIESRRGKYSNTVISVEFQSDKFERKHPVEINTVTKDKLQIAQQIAFILQSINGKSEKLTENERINLRKRLIEYIKVERI